MRRGHLDNHILPAFGDFELRAINLVQVENWLFELERSHATRNHIRSTMDIILNEARRAQLISANHIADVGRLSKSNYKKHDSLSLHDIKILFPNDEFGISSKLINGIRSGILGLSICVALFGYNVYGYAGNDLILILSIFCLALSSILLAFLFFQHKRLGKIDRAAVPLRDMLMSKIIYFQKSLYLVRHAIATCIVLLAFALNLAVDNNDGNYYVSKVWLYVGLVIITYGKPLPD